MADILGGLTLALLADWSTTLTLVFGGCCSNALTLEQLTSHYPSAGSLITFCQFLFISLHGLRKFVIWTPYPHLKPRRIPILPYIIQVALFYAISYLNNAAFAHKIPMTVHIIFRSGGLVISMIMGWLIQGRRYKSTQVASVILVTAGVVLTTLSASKPRDKTVSLTAEPQDVHADALHTKTYTMGIVILTLALVLSGLLGIAQDKTYSTYIRVSSPKKSKQQRRKEAPSTGTVEPWQESMFYMHFLSMPLFAFARSDLAVQFSTLRASPAYSVVLPPSVQATVYETLPFLRSGTASLGPQTFSLPVPSAYIYLLFNTLTQLVCVSGVHRLTSRVSSLTVTLVLVVRKAVSLIISVLIFGSGVEGNAKLLLLGGAASVFAGTLLYSLASAGSQKTEVAKAGSKKDKDA